MTQQSKLGDFCRITKAKEIPVCSPCKKNNLFQLKETALSVQRDILETWKKDEEQGQLGS